MSSAVKRKQRPADETNTHLNIPMLPMLPTGLDQAGLEALGLAQEQARRRESTGSLSSKYWLSLHPQPPRHPFVRTYFPVKVLLVDSKRALKTGWTLQLAVELLYENGEVVPNHQKHIEVHGHDESRPIILTGTGSIDLKVRILSCSMAHENKNFFIRFSGIPMDKNIPNYVTIMPATSTLMTVIRHRLRITEQPPALWYKDEGGRDKCIAVSGLLVDEHEQPVQGREVPLKVLLCYEGEDCTEVKNQSILKMPTDCTPKVDKFGKVHLKVRIEEVSKNHQKQAFVIKVAPDTAFSTENYDISADVSTPITVLSKRNKRRPKNSGDDDDSPLQGPTSLHSYQPTVFNLPAAPATMPMAYAKPTTLLANVGMNSLASASSSILPSITPTGAAAKPSLANTSLTGANMTRITSTDGSSIILNDSSEYKPHPSPSFSDTISHLVNWCQHVHDLLTKIEWQHVGFEVQEDGQMNLHRPLYRCPGCWAYQDTIRQTGHKDSCKISKLASAYRTHVHVYLQDLLNMATGNGASNTMIAPSSTNPSNPAQLASQNSLMAAYSKNNSGNLFLTHSNSLSGGRNQFSLPSATSIINSATSLGLNHQSSMINQRTPSVSGATKSELSTLPQASTTSSDDEPLAKKPKTDASSSLFPSHSSSNDWNNLAALDPLSSPNALIDRGLSSLGPVLGDRGLSVLDQTGHSSFASLHHFQASDSSAADAYMTDLPSDSLTFGRAGSSINIDSFVNDRVDESGVDAIHVTPTPYGFPAFSSSSNQTNSPASLLGMYQYDESTTFLAFVPLAKFPAITPTQVKEMERIYRSLRDSPDSGTQSRILTRAQCITLDKLKEDALLLHYATQANTSDNF